MRVYKNFINNDLVGAISGKTFPVDNPATEEVFAEFSHSGTRDVDAAVVASNLAFNGWRLTDPGSRSIYSLTSARKRKISGFPTVLKASRLRP